MDESLSLLTPPNYCQYSAGPCDQRMNGITGTEAFFIYPSEPNHLARTVAQCVRELKSFGAERKYQSWEELAVGGQIIFCELCKAIRTARLIVANITTTNFNVLFELGYAIGLGKPVLPVRDATYERDKKLFDEIGVFDTLGYEKFTNSTELQALVQKKRAFSAPIELRPTPDKKQPIFYVRSPIDTDGSIKLFSCLKKSYFRFRTFNSRETSRLSLHEAFKQTLSSVSVVAHLIDPHRQGAEAHNARAAFVCGIALAAGKHVLMFQEGQNPQPIDYRDIIVPYPNADVIPLHIERFLRETADAVQSIETARSVG